eukprot:TRINITY_DN108158_c0_g1_i1.p1 TRINITY_DN108158_c0_g1~~TRINITY_DN108158_c0_g1_i1.p1  ORF type:complete len:145 (-),score=13.84 TRINITY_DN108158_c0_g1_i1:2-412(-)
MAPFFDGLRRQVVVHGLAWSALLGTTNVLLRRYARRHPKSWMASQCVPGGAFEGRRHIFITCFFGMIVVQPLCWCRAWSGRETTDDWWFGSQEQAATGEFFAYCAGHFLQDAFLNERGTRQSFYCITQRPPWLASS